MDTSEKQIKKIVLNRMERCAVCHHSFAPDDIHIVSRKPDLWTMVVACAECHSRNFVAAVLGDGDPTQAQLALRRLSEQHAPATAERAADEPEPLGGEPVNVDDVLEMHGFLKRFDGDFQRLFRGS
ncbi:MAG: hypothetical protein M3509_04335 [Chloroflexota bacterium]|nr:hypothetical protein [Chloroflexota bacterium]